MKPNTHENTNYGKGVKNKQPVDTLLLNIIAIKSLISFKGRLQCAKTVPHPLSNIAYAFF